MRYEDLPLTELEAKCRAQTERFRRGQDSDTSFCLEIFRRALQHAQVEQNAHSSTPIYRDEAARETLVRLYTPFIEAKLNRYALRGRSPEDLCQQSWLRFWQAANRGLDVQTLEQVLQYLSRVALSTQIEAVRIAAIEAHETLFPTLHEDGAEVLPPDTSADPFELVNKRQFRDRCLALIADPTEREIFLLRYALAYKPQEIMKLLGKEWRRTHQAALTARAVSDILERIMKRLAKDEQIQDLLRDD